MCQAHALVVTNDDEQSFVGAGQSICQPVQPFNITLAHTLDHRGGCRDGLRHHESPLSDFIKQGVAEVIAGEHAYEDRLRCADESEREDHSGFQFGFSEHNITKARFVIIIEYDKAKTLIVRLPVNLMTITSCYDDLLELAGSSGVVVNMLVHKRAACSASQ